VTSTQVPAGSDELENMLRRIAVDPPDEVRKRERNAFDNLARPLGEHPLKRKAQGVVILDPRLARREARIGAQFRPLERGKEAGPELLR